MEKYSRRPEGLAGEIVDDRRIRRRSTVDDRRIRRRSTVDDQKN
jgi:hypothetical protein